MTPETWTSVPFWSLYRREKKTGFPAEELLSVYRDYGVIRKSDRDDNWNRPGEDMSAYQIVEEGDLVLNKMKTWQGSLGVSPYRGIVSPAYFVYKKQTADSERFLHFALRSEHYINTYASISKGVRPNQWDLQPEQLDVMAVLLPPRDEQERIADYLDRETGEIDAMLANMDKLAGTLSARRSSSINRIFAATDETVPLWSLTAGVIDCPHTTPEVHQDGEAEAVRTASVRSGKYVQGKGLRVSLETAAQRNGNFPPRPGDIFFTREAPAGEAAIVPTGQFCLGQRMVLLRVDPDVTDSRFLLYALYSTKVQEEFRLSAGGSTVVNLKLGTIRATQIPKAGLTEQKRIADHLDEVTGRIDAMLAKVAELKSLLIERRAALITDVVTGRKEVA